MIPRCSSRNRDGRPCGQYAVRDGRCYAHDPLRGAHSLTRRAEALARERAASAARLAADVAAEAERAKADADAWAKRKPAPDDQALTFLRQLTGCDALGATA